MEIGLLDDIQELHIDKDFRKRVKTQEELDKLSVDENLSEIDKTLFILSSGQELQYISVLRNLPFLLKTWPDCIKKVLPKVKEILAKSGLDVHVTAAEVFIEIITNKIVSISNFIQYFFQTIFTYSTKKVSEFTNIWLDALIKVVPYLSNDVVKRDVLPMAISKGRLSQPTASRLHSCKIIGAISQKFDANTIKKELVPTMRQLCQDVDQDVRSCMCLQLQDVAFSFGPTDTKGLIMDEIVELAADEESQVRVAAFDTFIAITSLLENDSILKMTPLVEKYCMQAIEIEDPTLLNVASNFGKLCSCVAKQISIEQRKNFINIFLKMCLLGRKVPGKTHEDRMKNVKEKLNSMSTANYQPLSFSNSIPHVQQHPQDLGREELVHCRRFSAFNLPAMFHLFPSQRSLLVDCLSILCSDDQILVRKHAAAGLHEVAHLLGKNADIMFLHLLTFLYEIQSPEVMQASFQHLDQTLVAIVVGANLAEKQPTKMADLVSALTNCLSKFEKEWQKSWRGLELLTSKLYCLHRLIPSDQIYSKFIPILFNLLTKNPYLPVRQAASSTICVLLRYNKRCEQRREILDKLIQDLSRSRSYRNRLLFFDFCEDMMKYFSKKFFKENIFEHVMVLFDDKVVNVRLCLCRILPRLKSLLKLPSDRLLHSQLEQGVRQFLSSETDKDVSKAIRMAIYELDRTTAQHLSQRDISDEDSKDLKKEEEEEQMFTKEDRSGDKCVRSGSHSLMSFKGKDQKKIKKRSSHASISKLAGPKSKMDFLTISSNSKDLLPNNSSKYLQLLPTFYNDVILQ